MEIPSEIPVSSSMAHRLLTTGPNESLQSAYERMDRRGVHHLPVIDEGGRLVGLLSHRPPCETSVEDFRRPLARSAGASASSPSYDVLPVAPSGALASQHLGTLESMFGANDDSTLAGSIVTQTVGQAMAPHPTVISPSTEVRDAAKLMIDAKVSALVVVDKREVVGLITHEDMLRVLVDLLDGNLGDLKRIEAAVFTSPIGDVMNALNNMGL